jgi:uncharacterized protein
MRILIDIGHPGHVHYFRNFIKRMKEYEHEFLVIARDKEVTFKLLEYYKIPFKSRGKGGKGFFWKLIYILVADFRIFYFARKFKPDLFLSFSSTYAGHAAFLINKPHILFDDTEHAKFEHIMYKPFAKAIINPSCFYKKMGRKQFFFNGFMELCYLHPNLFFANPDVLELLNISKNEKYIIIRFVSWQAGHDFGYHGLNYNSKLKIVSELSRYSKVFISSESQLPKDLEKFRMIIPSNKLHDAIYYSSLYLGEGGTTASEAAIMGIPAIYVNSLPLMGYLKEEQDRGLLFHMDDTAEIILRAKEIILNPDSKAHFIEKRKELLKDKINVTDFMIWFCENYPASAKIMKDNPDYQDNFK